MQDELRARAADTGCRLPFDVLSESLALLPVEEIAVLVCAAPEFERSYGRIYGYVLDDLNRQHPCVELICMLAAEAPRQRLVLRSALGRFGRLRRAGILQPLAEAAIEAKQELRLAPALLDFLLGAPCDPTMFFRDRAEVIVPARVELPPEISRETAVRLAKSLVERRVSAVGVWGPRYSGKEEFLFVLTSALGMSLRRLNVSPGPTGDVSQGVWRAVQTASVLGAILWVEVDKLQAPDLEHMRETVVEAIAGSTVPVFLTGTHPWRPVRLLESRGYTEFELTAPGFQMRKAMWSRTLPEVTEPQISELAARFRLSGAEMRAATQLARTTAEFNGNGHRAELVSVLEGACTTVTRKRSDHFATAVKPKRTAEDLVLPEDVHKQVIEIAHFFRASAQVDEEWGFGRMTPGGGIKVLFTGEPGTGKTLGAEVIAGILGLPLLKVDLARVVSKWVGETEKNLDTVFREAEESHSVLFFDEADSLFGKRGEVQHGTDRYANLEVGFLLQRLEDYFGLVILASNLKDQIDTAFTRRFHVIVHFPLPRPAERRRIWKLAFPPNSPTEAVDLDMLQQLDMTGAAIVSAARTAALLAANENSLTISMAHVVKGIARQFRREARIMTPTMMGSYASLLNGTL
jgi:AAA+ superfamily predicted ATPase